MGKVIGYAGKKDWEVVDNVETKSLTTLKKELALLRKVNTHLEFRAFKITGPRGGVSYGIECRKKRR